MTSWIFHSFECNPHSSYASWVTSWKPCVGTIECYLSRRGQTFFNSYLPNHDVLRIPNSNAIILTLIQAARKKYFSLVHVSIIHCLYFIDPDGAKNELNSSTRNIIQYWKKTKDGQFFGIFCQTYDRRIPLLD